MISEQVLQYPTHRLVIKDISNTKFVKVTNFVEGRVYDDMVESILSDKENRSNFVLEERVLLNNFLKSLVSFHNKADNLLLGQPEMYVFSDEAEYYVHCLINDLPYNEQEWFNTILIRTNILVCISLLKDASIKLVKTLYPQYYSKPISVFEDLFKDLYTKKTKCEINLYKDFLISNEIERLYHFSSRNNLSSIKENGICSVSELAKLGLSVNYSSSSFSRQIDSNKDLSDYVHLSYERKHPMLFVALAEGRIYDYVIFEIQPIVIFQEGTKFSNMNAAKKNAIISDDINFFLKIPFDRFHNREYYSLNDEDKNWYQSEILVRQKIVAEQIINIKEL